MRDTLSPKRRLAVAGITTLCMMAVAVPAAAQTGGSGPPGGTTTTTPPTAPVGPPGRARLLKDGTAVAPADAPANIQAAIAAGNAIHTLPYVWGGGHRSFTDTGYDCSGAVSYVLHAAGLLASPMPSGPLASSWGAPRQGSLDHGLREREPRLHDRGGPAVRHLLRRRSLEPGQRSALAQEEAQAGGLQRQVLPGLLTGFATRSRPGAAAPRKSRRRRPAPRCCGLVAA